MNNRLKTTNSSKYEHKTPCFPALSFWIQAPVAQLCSGVGKRRGHKTHLSEAAGQTPRLWHTSEAHTPTEAWLCFQCCRAPKRGKSLGKWKICISSWRTWGHNKPDIGVVSHGRLVVCTVINLGSTGQPGKTAPCLSFGIPK